MSDVLSEKDPAPDAAGSSEPDVSAAVPAADEVNGELPPEGEDLPAVEDPALLGAALRQELAGDGGVAARRAVIGVGLLVFVGFLTMLFYALRTAPDPADRASGKGSSAGRGSSRRRSPGPRQTRPRPAKRPVPSSDPGTLPSATAAPSHS